MRELKLDPNNVDLDLGRELMNNLCEDCKYKIEQDMLIKCTKKGKIRLSLIQKHNNPNKIKRFIDENCCDDCKNRVNLFSVRFWHEQVKGGEE